MKFIKLFFGALLFLILMAGNGFAQSPELSKLRIKIGELKNKLTILKNDVDDKKTAFDTKINSLLTKTVTSVTQLTDAEAFIKDLETEIQKLYPPDCIKDNPYQAETECPFYMHLYSGAEFIGSNEFGESFARGGMQLRSTIAEFEISTAPEWLKKHRISFMVDIALTSRVVQTSQDPSNPSIFQTEGAKALEGRMGLMIDLANPTTKFTGTQSYTATNTIALLAELGFDSVDELPAGSGFTIDGPSDLFQHHFAGIRIYHRGVNRFNGAYADIGWGISENFIENESKRFKVRGYLPILINKKHQFKLVTMIEVDSDFKEGPDETKLIIGATIDPESFFNITPLGWLAALFDDQ